MNDLEKWIGSLGHHEFMWFYVFMQDPSDENYVLYVIGKLRDEEERLLKKGTPREKFPKVLQDPDWRSKIWAKFAIEDPYKKAPNQQVKEFQQSHRVNDAVKERIVEPPSVKTSRVNDPTRTDGYGSVLGDDGSEWR